MQKEQCSLWCEATLAIFYGFLAFTFVAIIATSRLSSVKRILFKRVPAVNYKYWYDKRAVKWFASKKTMESLIYQTLFNATGDTLALLLGFVMLPVSKNSFLATVFEIPYTSLTQIHIWVGRTLFALVVFHLGSGLAMHIALGTNLVKKFLLVEPNSPWGTSRYQSVLGVAAFAGHFAYCGHVPCRLLLYTIDGITRLSSRFSKDTVASTLFEKCGYITLTLSTTKAANAKPGQFMRLCFPAISQLEFHPWSIVKSDSTSVTFMFSANTAPNSWTSRVVQLLKSHPESPEKIAVLCQGPYGSPLDSRNPTTGKDALVFYVGGTGISAYLNEIGTAVTRNECPVFLLWSSKHNDLNTLSHIEELYGLGGQVTVELFETGHEGASRSDLNALLGKHLVPLIASEKTVDVGVYVCGPREFNSYAMKAIREFEGANKGVRLTADVGSYEL
ncbi:hypothetical protein BDR26DRAFT_1002713 [Obelidium mucronatum]|nr:hypothetical protein BDR26DRAFT_1002713 [Obelidium mucronatum]